ncbi:MAG TPA: hypothetical protein VGV13_08270 [Methylomirabilota bacterium]|jgi:hypothetical protein|nr:hypothetical protein [Methylomirabilota bacterium]
MSARKGLDPRVLRAIQELGRIGGQTRAKNLTAERRREIAKKAAAARWKK